MLFETLNYQVKVPPTNWFSLTQLPLSVFLITLPSMLAHKIKSHSYLHTQPFSSLAITNLAITNQTQSTTKKAIKSR